MYFYRRRSHSSTTAASSGAAPGARRKPAGAQLTVALQALGGDFVVADLETTGLSTSTCEILEFAAVRVRADGAIEREFSQVVKTQARIPPFIAQLTGITQAEVERDGVPLRQAYSAFLEFLEDRPVFFHNASFDKRFLNAAAVHTGMPLGNLTHCTLALARQAWPELPTHKLGDLARHLGAAQPTHRALADVRTTVAVALAARARLNGA